MSLSELALETMPHLLKGNPSRASLVDSRLWESLLTPLQKEVSYRNVIIWEHQRESYLGDSVVNLPTIKGRAVLLNMSQQTTAVDSLRSFSDNIAKKLRGNI